MNLAKMATDYYGVIVPKRYEKIYMKLVVIHLERRYPVESAIGLALNNLRLSARFGTARRFFAS